MTRRIFPVIALAAIALNSCAQNHSSIHDTKNFDVKSGRTLFLKNCAHCHGADATGDEGPDLHKLAWTDEQITTRIRKGKAGQMTAFGGELAPEEISALVGYLRTLK